MSELNKKLKVVVVGVRFGGAFVPLYLNHPDVERVGVCDVNPDMIQRMLDRYGDLDVYDDFEKVLEDDTVDAVHILTPPAFHVDMCERALLKGKHVACAVTMGTTIEELQRIINAVNKSNKKYMMMETSIFTRNFLYTKRLLDEGKMGKVQFLKAEYYQDVEGLQPHWLGYPPMHYATHAFAPLCYLAKSKIKRIFCFGSGEIKKEFEEKYGNPFAVESAVIEFENGLKGSVARSFNGVSKDFIEMFDCYGEKMTFEWQQIGTEHQPVVYKMADSLKLENGNYRWRPVEVNRITVADEVESLPEKLRPFVVEREYSELKDKNKKYKEGGDHHGSHPFLVHDFIRSIVEDRAPICDHIAAANICAAGILCHESALQGGVLMEVPNFE